MDKLLGERCTQLTSRSGFLSGERYQLMLLTIALFMTVAGARLLVLKLCGSDVPQYDQWGAEATEFYKPFLEGSYPLGNFFASHNEHRILFARLLSLGLFLMNGLWDMRLQMVVNALIYSVTAAGVFWVVSRELGRVARMVWWLAVAAVFSLPYGWENALWGFQSQFYFLVSFSLLVLYVSWLDVNSAVKWGTTLFVLQFATLFTMGSGVMAAVAVLAMQLLAIFRNAPSEIRDRRAWVRIVVTTIVVGTGFLLLEHVPVHEKYKAQSLTDFVAVFAHCASWPLIQSSIWGIANWLPFALLVVVYLFGKCGDKILVRFSISMGLWVLLQEIATAYSRNGLALRSKYSDTMAIGILVNVLALLILFGVFGRPWKRTLAGFALLWGLTNAYALGAMTVYNVNVDLPRQKYFYEMQVLRTRAYLYTGNFEALIPERYRYELPHTNIEAYAKLLQDPFIRSILPRSLNDNAVLTGTPKAYLSTAALYLVTWAVPLLAIGVVLMIVTTACIAVPYFIARSANAKNSIG